MVQQRDARKAPGRNNPTYEPSGHGTYNSRWRKQERRKAALARQKKLCESGKTVQRVRQRMNSDEADEDYDFGVYVEVKQPMDWKKMLPESERQQQEEEEKNGATAA